MTEWHIGTMGFAYKGWVGPFYPAGMPQSRFLAHYATRFTAVEIDSTFYGIPRPGQVQRWANSTPPGFTFALKTPRAITHELGLAAGQAMMAEFLIVVRGLGEKLGVVLIQFGPDFTAVAHPILAQFLSQLPTDIRFAVEFRHISWDTPETNALLAAHRICRTAADYLYMPKEIQPTTDFLYLRFIGPHGQFGSKDRELVDKTVDLAAWYQQMQPHLPHMPHVYLFINNDYAGYSPATCQRWQRIAGLEPPEIRPLVQGRLL